MENNVEQTIAWCDVFKPHWYVTQMKGWTTRSYVLLLFGLGTIFGMTVASGINELAIFTLLAGMLGFTCTLSITNAKPLNGILGLVSALIYVVVAIQAKNYNDVMLQLTYIVLLDLPVLLMPSWAKDVDKKVRFLHEKGNGLRNWLLVLLFFVVITGILYYSDTHIFISPRPWVDSIAAAIGITGAFLTTLRFSESYYCWTIQGIMSVVLWGLTAVQGDANYVLFVTYILYLTNDLLAFFDKNVSWFHHKKVA
ncbi:nicotinamide riboside transporter PnuC [Limosilactobacillus pontis]|uniref:Nicotinamide riboside transporter PnuC n=1 Tax=Limosilactobacillus pontis TaxID=35787 RepID=A0ABT7UZ81_9LACO|nr:nicotinamide riboside transporter PnuC [Limosilactobacillus pontis]MDM8267010.1 nicotinamide riboside transporter PnuC [Limosilactobacillus pontis]